MCYLGVEQGASDKIKDDATYKTDQTTAHNASQNVEKLRRKSRDDDDDASYESEIIDGNSMLLTLIFGPPALAERVLRNSRCPFSSSVRQSVCPLTHFPAEPLIRFF